MMWWGNGWTMGWGWFFGALVMIGFVLVIAAVIAAVLGRWNTGSDATRSPLERGSAAPTPLQILDERYARGEIGTEEYQERSRALGRP